MDENNARTAITDILLDIRAMDEKKARKAITDILLDIGAGEHLLGFPMLEDAIFVWMNGEHRNIYKTLAVKYSCTAQVAERRIRKCIEYAFQNCSHRVLDGYLYGTVSVWKEKTSNYLFFARIARKAQEKLEWGEIDGN